jgi:RyR domain-containing protein
VSDEEPAPYRPRPIDTSGIGLPPEIEQATEDLARNAHETWAALRLSQGWRHGPERNDARKEHPSLVPYEVLPESEKQADRETAMGTLKALMALGYTAVSIKPGPALDDMVDADRWLDSPKLGEALLHCRSRLLPDYRALDTRALDLQWGHFWFARAVIALATFAILVALLQVYALLPPPILWLAPSLRALEVAAGVFAMLVVGAGIMTGTHAEWLLCRHKAERLRYAKFRLLTSPDFWSPERRPLAFKELDDTRDAINRLDGLGVRSWLEKDEAPRGPAVSRDARLDVAGIRVLRDYYHDTRFAAQLAYLAAKARPASEPRSILKRLPQALFFATTGIIILHFALEIFHLVPEGGPTVALILLAVFLPAAGAAFRSYFMAREMGRNATRSAAKYLALEDMTRPLREDQEPEAILGNLWACEYIIESDHREWLRLMIDAEWFG